MAQPAMISNKCGILRRAASGRGSAPTLNHSNRHGGGSLKPAPKASAGIAGLSSELLRTCISWAHEPRLCCSFDTNSKLRHTWSCSCAMHLYERYAFSALLATCIKLHFLQLPSLTSAQLNLGTNKHLMGSSAKVSLQLLIQIQGPGTLGLVRAQCISTRVMHFLHCWLSCIKLHLLQMLSPTSEQLNPRVGPRILSLQTLLPCFTSHMLSWAFCTCSARRRRACQASLPLFHSLHLCGGGHTCRPHECQNEEWRSMQQQKDVRSCVFQFICFHSD